MSARLTILVLLCLFGASVFAEEEPTENPTEDAKDEKKEKEAEEKHFGLSTTELTQLIEQENDVASSLLDLINKADEYSGTLREGVYRSNEGLGATNFWSGCSFYPIIYYKNASL